MLRSNVLVATIAEDAEKCAREFGFGIELDEFCTASNMEGERFPRCLENAERYAAVSENRWFHAPFSEICPSAVDPKMRALALERLDQAFRLAQSLGYKRMVLHSGYIPFVYFKEWFSEQSVLFWRGFLSDKPADFRFALENVLDDEPDTLLAVASGVNDPRFGLCFDLGHANVVTKVPLEKWIETYGERLFHLHIHNNYGDRDAHLPLGDGNIDIKRLVSLAESLSPGVTATIENLNAGPSCRWLEESGLLED